MRITTIGFNTGLPDIVEHKKTGYLAQPFNVADLVEGIMYIITRDKDEYKNLCLNSPEKL